MSFLLILKVCHLGRSFYSVPGTWRWFKLYSYVNIKPNSYRKHPRRRPTQHISYGQITRIFLRQWVVQWSLDSVRLLARLCVAGTVRVALCLVNSLWPVLVEMWKSVYVKEGERGEGREGGQGVGERRRERKNEGFVTSTQVSWITRILHWDFICPSLVNLNWLSHIKFHEQGTF